MFVLLQQTREPDVGGCAAAAAPHSSVAMCSNFHEVVPTCPLQAVLFGPRPERNVARAGSCEYKSATALVALSVFPFSNFLTPNIGRCIRVASSRLTPGIMKFTPSRCICYQKPCEKLSVPVQARNMCSICSLPQHC